MSPLLVSENQQVRLSPHDELVYELRALRSCLAELHQAIALSNQLQITSENAVFLPQMRQTIAPAAVVKIARSAEDTDWIISVEQSTVAVALAVHFSNGRTMVPIAQLQAGDTMRFPVLTSFLILENVGAATLYCSVWETNE